LVTNAKGGSPAPRRRNAIVRPVGARDYRLAADVNRDLYGSSHHLVLDAPHPNRATPGVSTSASPTGLPAGVISWRVVPGVRLYRAAVNAVLPVHLGPLSTNVVASTPDTVPFEVKRPDSFSFSPTLPL
jgi:hypothetical protein